MKKLAALGIVLFCIQSAFAGQMLSISGQMKQLIPTKKPIPTCQGVVVECKAADGDVGMVPVIVASVMKSGQHECLPNNETINQFIHGDAQDICKGKSPKNPCHAKGCKYIGWGHS